MAKTSYTLNVHVTNPQEVKFAMLSEKSDSPILLDFGESCTIFLTMRDSSIDNRIFLEDLKVKIANLEDELNARTTVS